MKSFKNLICFVLLFNLYQLKAQTTPKDSSKLPIDPETNCVIRYYYFPNLEAYFDNLELIYHYKIGGKWEVAENLPSNYGGYSIYNNVKLPITDFEGNDPSQMIQIHKKMYPYSAKGKFKIKSETTSSR